jgi:hypothetical protein
MPPRAIKGFALVVVVLLRSSTALGVENSGLMSRFAYISAPIGAYFCSCRGWPSTWDAIRRFDDGMHARAEAQGQKPLKRFPWSQYEGSRLSVNAKQQVLIDLVSPDLPAGTQIGFSVPDCSEGHPEVMRDLCPPSSPKTLEMSSDLPPQTSFVDPVLEGCTKRTSNQPLQPTRRTAPRG